MHFSRIFPNLIFFRVWFLSKIVSKLRQTDSKISSFAVWMVGNELNSSQCIAQHSLIRGVLIQSCSTGAKYFTNYVICHPQFRGVIQNNENRCTIRAKFWKFDFWLYKIDYFYNNQHRQTGVKMAQRFSIFWITPLHWIVDDKIHNWWNF